jgi:hypothetical protein
MRRVPVNQNGLKLNGTYQLLFYVVDVNILGGSVHSIKENAEALLVGSKETGLEVNADKSKYMFICRDQNAGRSHNMKICNCSIEKVGQFNYLRTYQPPGIYFSNNVSEQYTNLYVPLLEKFSSPILISAS